MSIIIKDEQTGEISLFMKGADTVMAQMVTFTDWLEEETGNMAREGLRTLVVGKKVLTEEQYLDFESRYDKSDLARCTLNAVLCLCTAITRQRCRFLTDQRRSRQRCRPLRGILTCYASQV